MVNMKKFISIFFILLANITILAHAVVPHHHHNKIFAAVINVLDNDTQKALNHSHDESTHHHGDNPEDCAINETVVAAAFKLQKDSNCNFDYDLLSMDLFTAEILSIDDPKPDRDLLFVLKPYVAGIHTDYIARSIGLRAPPIC